jgi:steroid delta-isomerase-like uncharacterized protein
VSDLVARDAGLAERWRAAWLAGTPEAFGDCCHVDVYYEDPFVSEALEGLGALATHARRLRDSFPDMRIEAGGPEVISGNHAALPWRFLGTNKRDLGMLPASDRFLALHGIHFLELRDGDVRRARGFFDLYDVAVQLALLPKRGSLGETALMALRGFGILRPRA